MTLKRTSIILCTHNEANYIENTISELEKNIPNLEIVIVDDASTDGTGTHGYPGQVRYPTPPASSNIETAQRRGCRYSVRRNCAPVPRT